MFIELYRLGRIRERNPDLQVRALYNGQAWQADWTREGVETIVTRYTLGELLDHLENALPL